MAIGNLIPLIILLVVVGVGAFVGYHLYVWSNELADRANKKMAKSNVSFTKDGGLRVGVKDIGEETYADKTQNVLVNVWNNAELPNYKSRLGWNSTQADSKKSRNPLSRKSSSNPASPPPPGAAAAAAAVADGTGLAPPSNAACNRKRSTSPVPGGWNS